MTRTRLRILMVATGTPGIPPKRGGGLERVITGPLYGWDKLEACVDADVYVLPSRYEIWGIARAQKLSVRDKEILKCIIKGELCRLEKS